MTNRPDFRSLPGQSLARREFLRRIAMGAGVACVGEACSAEELTVSAQRPDLSGELILIGHEGRLNASRIDFHEKSSVLTRLRLKDGAATSIKLPMEKAHIAQPLSRGHVLCCPQNGAVALVVDASNAIVRRFEAPEGYYYSGHGLLLHVNNTLLLPMCKRRRVDASDRGAVEVYEATDYRLLSRIENWGVNPHEIQYLPSRKSLVVADYGTLTAASRPVLSTFGLPSIFTCDPDTLAIDQVFDQSDLNGAVTHLRVTDEGHAYFILQQSVFMETRSGQGTFADAVRAADQVVERDFRMPPRNYALPFIQYKTPELSVPRPFVRLNLLTGIRQTFLLDPQYHIRPQSVEHNRLTGLVVASYTGSDCLVAQRGEGQPYIIDGADIGLTEIRGLAEIPGTPYIGVAGSERNVAIVDLRIGSAVARFRTDNFVAPHMSFSPSA